MHKVLDNLGKVREECHRTDKLAKHFNLTVSSGDRDSLRWGYSDFFMPKSRVEKPMQIGFSRDVFLLPDSHIEFDYELGFADEFELSSSRLIVAYRLTFTQEFGEEDSPTIYSFPVTIFYEAVENRWRASAKIRHGEEKKTPYVRPKNWADMLEASGLDFGELAQGLKKDRAYNNIEAMMAIAVSHAPSRKQLKARVLRAG